MISISHNIFRQILAQFIDLPNDLKQSETNPSVSATIAKAAALALSQTALVPRAWAGESRPLKPVLQALGNKDAGQSFTFQPQSLNLESKFFPHSDAIDADGFKILYDDFISKAQELQQQTADLESDRFAKNLFTLLEKQTATVGYTEGATSDVPLAELVRLTTALTICLEQAEDKEKPILLIGADLSGIQEFIYDIISKNAAKNFKGRSFYLQLVANSILYKLLNALGLWRYSIVFDSGGSFFVVAPNTQKNKDAIARVRTEITEKLREEQGLYLFASIAYEEVAANSQAIKNAWDISIRQGLSKYKKQKFKDDLTQNFEDYFTPKGQGGRMQCDSITNEEFKLGERLIYLNADANLEEDDPKRLPVKLKTKLQIDLGKKLRKHVIWGISTFSDTNSFNPANLGIYYRFFEKKEINSIAAYEDEDIFLVNDTEGSLGVGFYGGNDFPTKEGEDVVKDFSDLAESKGSLQRLGVLRMDVDDLGLRLRTGLGDAWSLARFATVSKHLDWFFKGYLNTIWKSSQTFKDQSYIVYSGGDDLLFVGRWECAVEFANLVYEHFSNWIGKNPYLSISGGVAIVHSHFPIIHTAKLAGKAEDKAKEHENTEGLTIKNAFNFLDTTVGWKKEFQEVKGLKIELTDYEKQKKTSKSLLSKIDRFATMQAEQEKHKLTQTWLWLSVYDLSRYARTINVEKANDARQFVWKLQKDILNPQYLQRAALAARWAELEYRTLVNNDLENDKTVEQ